MPKEGGVPKNLKPFKKGHDERRNLKGRPTVKPLLDAIADAKENAALNNIRHAEFFTGDVIKICNDINLYCN